MSPSHDLAILGGGPGGLVAARFAARLGARVVLVEKHRIGGDCTWTGCVPSKALIRAARAAREIRNADRFGVHSAEPVVDMPGVRAWIRGVVDEIHAAETPEQLEREGIEVILQAGEFIDRNTLRAGDRTVTARRYLICTGAWPMIPDLEGLGTVPFATSETIFDNDRLPARLIVIGAGPLGLEIAQAYRGLGADVSVIGPQLLPREEPESQAFVESLLKRENIEFLQTRAESVRLDGASLVVTTPDGTVTGDLLLVATGRRPVTDDLGLERAGVEFTTEGIRVDQYLRTTVPHIYAAGDVTGSPPFTHTAGWQSFHAVRNALLPGRTPGNPEPLSWVTFLEPEIARVGASEAEAVREHGIRNVVASTHPMAASDRALCDGEPDGFIKIVTRTNGAILGATIVATRAGEMIGELALAMKRGLRLGDLAAVAHAYPSWTLPIQQIASDHAVRSFVTSRLGRFARRISRLHV